MRTVLALFFSTSMLLSACNLPGNDLPSIRPVPVLPMQALQNARIHSPDWGDYQLTDGIYYRPPMNPGEASTAYTSKFWGPTAYGDLDADGAEDAVIFLNTQNGGTGHFIEMAVMLNRDGQPENAATVSLGDRVGVEAARIEAGVIVLDMRVQGPNDPLCCASQAETWRFRMEGTTLLRLP